MKESRQQRRNEINQKTAATFDQGYDVIQTGNLAEKKKARDEMYETLASLAEVNDALPTHASDEEVQEEGYCINTCG
jgi:hypothetical protein